MHFTAANEDDTRRLAEALAAAVGPGDVVALEGDLGTGKTTLTRHLVRALGVGPDIPVTSPTFTLVNQYTAEELEIIHADLYRLGDAAEEVTHMMAVRASVIEGLHDARGRLQKAAGAS